ncbi:condensation domain-containing protein [Pseudomonas sp. P9_31]|uniref:condensation domain-containing protein n=1 Tax=Pseudomonas sp. P9_31 TaxID=3043448 RepID=UPI002A35E7DB|nr:condensation domain-containing protein [Pseudomonas sp. P9_31]WPN60166.1 condensation domain-containing protein [Pseudomonas sp. P9_31]
MTGSMKDPTQLAFTSEELGALEHFVRSSGLVSDVAVVHSPPYETVRRCRRCAISTQVSGIRLDHEGVCTECRRYDRYKERLDLYFGDRDALQAIVAANRPHKRSDIDCMLLFSGGKDSTYVLHQLVDMQLKVMTYTFDNGFISRQAFDNIARITSDLNIEHITGTHAQMREVFRESLQRYSTVCKGCFKALLDHSLTLADQRGINLIFTGMSRGQIVEERLRFFHDRNIFDPQIIDAKLAEGRRIYHQVERYAGLDGKQFYDDSIFDRVRLIDFYRYSNAQKKDIYDYLSTSQAGWKEPEDTGFCSSNCLINDVGVAVHGLEKGYSNYEIPTAWEVRLGHLDRDSALAELAGVSDNERVTKILRSIDYVPTPVEAVPAEVEIFSVLKSDSTMADLEHAVKTRWPRNDVVPKLIRVTTIRRDERGQPIPETLAPQVTPVEIIPPKNQNALSTAQRQFLQSRSSSKEDWITRVIATREPLDQNLFRRALFQVLTLHPSLRLQLSQTDSGVEGKVAPIPNALPLIWADLSAKSNEQREILEARLSNALLSKTGSGLNEPLALFAVASPNSEGKSTLAIALHRIVMDEASWSILFAHLEWFYRLIATDTQPRLPVARAGDFAEPGLPSWVGPKVRAGSRPIRHLLLGGETESASLAQHIAEAFAPLSVSILTSLRQTDDQRIGHLTGNEQRQRGEDPDVVIVLEHTTAPDCTLFAEEQEVSDLAIAGGRSWVVIRRTASGIRLCWSADLDDEKDAWLTKAIESICSPGQSSRGGAEPAMTV